MVTGSSDKTVRLWDAATGKELRALGAHEQPIRSVAFSPDGRWVLSCGLDSTARLWEAASGRELHVFGMRGPGHSVTCAAFSPDGRWVLTGSYDKTARLWEAATGKQVTEFRGHSAEILCVAFSPDGRQVVTGSHDKTARLWEAATGKELQLLYGVFKGHVNAVSSVAFSADGRWVLTGSWDSTAHLWNAATGYEQRIFRGHGDLVRSVAFSPDGRWVLTRGFHKTTLWNAATAKPVHAFGEFGAGGGSESSVLAAFSPDGRWVLTASKDATAGLWDVISGKQVREFRGHGPLHQIACVAFSPDGRWVLTGSGDNTARLWEAASGKELRSFAGYASRVVSVGFFPDGRCVLYHDGIKKMLVWETASGQVHIDFGDPVGRVDWLLGTISPDGRWKLSFDPWEGTVHVWEAGNGKAGSVFRGHMATGKPPGLFAFRWSPVNCIAFASDGRRVLTGGLDPTPRLWELATGKEIRAFQGHAGWIAAVAFSPDGRCVLSGSSDGTARLWDIATGNPIHVLRGHAGPVHCVAFSPDGHWVLTGSEDRTARLWEAASGKERRCFRGHGDSVKAVAFSPDGCWVLTGSDDKAARLWESATGRELCALIRCSGGMITATPDNYYMGPAAALQAVAWRVGDRALPFDQFDLKFNRPDIVLARLGKAPREVIDAYHQAYQRRLRKMDFTEAMLRDDFHIPEVSLLTTPPLSTAARILRLKVRARDSKYPLKCVNVRVNGVPLHGRAGIDLRDPKTQRCDQQIEVPLSAGSNSLRISVLNEQGAESLAEVHEIQCNAAAQPNLYVLAIGVSQYQDKDMRLRYAAQDADAVCQFFRNHHGLFHQVYAKALLDADATRENIVRVATGFLKEAGVDDEVLLFFAGHGLLAAPTQEYYFGTVDLDFDAPTRRGLPYEAIERLLDGVRARRKLLLLDTCHAGEVDRDDRPGGSSPRRSRSVVRGPGLRKSEPEGVVPLTPANARPLFEDLFADLRRGTGAVVLAASRGWGFAQEDRRWGGHGAFTHCLLQGLQQGVGKPGRLRVSELRGYVLQQVQRCTNGAQVPTVRADNIEYDFPVF